MIFEYLVGGFSDDVSPEQQQARLNELGDDGWELVSTRDTTVGGNPYAMFYFKRDKFGLKHTA